MTPSRWSRGPEPKAPEHIRQVYRGMPEMQCLGEHEKIWQALRSFDWSQLFAHAKKRNLEIQLRYLTWLTGAPT